MKHIRLNVVWDALWEQMTANVWDQVRDYICDFDDNMLIAYYVIEDKISRENILHDY